MKNKIYKHRVDINHNLKLSNAYDYVTAVISWCYDTYGDPDKDSPTWDVVGPGVYGFVRESDATMFKLRWS